MLTNSEKTALCVLLGKHTGSGVEFDGSALRIILLLAQALMSGPMIYGKGVERLAADYQKHLDDEAEHKAKQNEPISATNPEWPEFLSKTTEPVPTEEPLRVSSPALIDFENMTDDEIASTAMAIMAESLRRKKG